MQLSHAYPSNGTERNLLTAAANAHKPAHYAIVLTTRRYRMQED